MPGLWGLFFAPVRFTYFPHPTTGARCVQPGTAAGTPGCASGQTYERYDLDANGNRTGLQLRDGQVISYTFDHLNRQTLKDLPGGTASDVYSQYDLAGRPQWLKFASASGEGIVYGYDSAKRLTSETSFGRAVSLQYDVGGNRTRLTWPDAHYLQYTYDALNRLDQVRENGATSGAGLLADYGYDALSRRTSLARGNGTAASYGYDLASRLSGLTQDFAGTGQDLALALTYTAASQLQTRSSAQGLFDHGGALVNRSYAANKLNQYTTVGGTAHSHDARGNLTSEGSRTFGYDGENRLTSVSGSASLALTYDPLGRLRQSTAGSTVTQFLYEGDRLIAEYAGSTSTVLRRYAHGAGVDEPLTWYEGAALTDRRTLHADERGSILATSNASGVATPYTYGPYGEPASWSGPRFRYTGQAALPEVQLYHYKARVYDPALGRFLQTDPVEYEDDLNLYAYVGNDPLNQTDPSGNCPECLGALIGVGFEFVVETAEIGAGVRTDGYSGKDLLVAGIAGATGVGAAKLIGRATELGTAAKFIANRVADGTVGAGSQAAKNGNVSASDLAIDVVAGATLGEAAGARAGAAARRSAEGQILERNANRAERVARDSDRPGRQAAAQEARATEREHTENAAVRASAIGAGAGSSAVQVTCTVVNGQQQCR